MTDLQQTEGLYGSAPDGPVPAAAPPSLLDQLLGLFTEPVALFRRLEAAPVWKGATALTVVFSLAMTVVWALKVDVDAMLRPVLDQDPRLAPDQIDRIIGFQSKFIVPGGIIGVFVGVALGLLVLALVYWLVGKRMAEDGPPTYLQAFSVAAVSSLVMVPHQLLILVMCLVKPVGGLAPDKIPPSSLGYFITVENGKLHTLLYKLDVFTVYSLVLVYLGARYGLRLKASGAAVCCGVAAMIMVILPAVFGH